MAAVKATPPARGAGYLCAAAWRRAVNGMARIGLREGSVMERCRCLLVVVEMLTGALATAELESLLREQPRSSIALS